ncbi:MAG: hypothetical protein HN742_22180 [Lentisphaerae bacterium]|jgi:uroporphyrinogen decarboxylase|nr:hypothetical protein [Lentisphaerota bacterium]MBT4819345.1 hypothetical protein [Lentisphaerota bacterium]MBT5605267.1 hypothetical protein [Lentisphaerota bacterium]MBT7059246.1 hypothetical protein [Lentisphaerota bacterium]MBT7844601.1 hypothetical protein [Lentisphaerota bacterium]
MGQSSYEIVKTAIYQTAPERLPVRMGCFGCDDTMGIPFATGETRVDGVRVADEWGCAWEQTEMANMGQVTGHPITLEQVPDFVAPDYSDDWRYADAEAVLERAETAGKYTCVGIFFVLFERMHALVGFESLLMGLALEPDLCTLLADKIIDAQLVRVRNFQERFGTRIHAFSMTDDWGTQQAAFVSKNMWDEIFFPRYKRLFDAMHEGGQDVWVHSCGKVNEIVEGYIAAGVNVVNLQQPRALGIEEMGTRYRGRICFESLADIQMALPTDDEREIEADARALAKHWMSPEGGFILSDYGDGAAIGASPEAKRKMYAAFSRVSEDLYGKPLPTPQT